MLQKQTTPSGVLGWIFMILGSIAASLGAYYSIRGYPILGAFLVTLGLFLWWFLFIEYLKSISS